MKKHIPLFIICLTAIIIVIGFFYQKRITPNGETMQYTLEGKTLTLLVADTDKERQKGLMYYRTLEHADGMIFKFPSSTYQSFWNKNTYMDLDVYWIEEDNVVGKSFLPSIEKSKEIVTIKSPAKANIVVEIPRK